MDDNFLANIENTCPNIYKFLLTSQDNNIPKVLRCLAVIKAYSENWLNTWQKFIIILGHGHGKSVFLRLLQDIPQTHHHIQGDDLKFYLRENHQQITWANDTLIISDVESLSGDSLDVLKILVSGDVALRVSHHTTKQLIKFKGNVIVESNTKPPILNMADMERREVLVEFNHQLPPDRRIADLSDKIKEEIPMLLNHLSDMSQDDCKNLLDDQTHP